MEITEGQYQRIAPRNAILYLAEPGCKWRGLPESFGPWHTVYMRWRPWNKRGVLARVFAELPEAGAAGGSLGGARLGQRQCQGAFRC